MQLQTQLLQQTQQVEQLSQKMQLTTTKCDEMRLETEKKGVKIVELKNDLLNDLTDAVEQRNG